MSSDEQLPAAWEPLTPRGVAAFAHAKWGRLWLVQLLVAVAAAAGLAWAIHSCWFGIISAAVDHLPAQGSIRGGKLLWDTDSPQVLAENRFLAITVDLDHQGQARSPAHLQVEFGRSRVRVFSLLGFLDRAYPRGYTIAFNRAELIPWWGAWAPAFLAIIVGGAVAGLLGVWQVLAVLYAPAAWLVAFFANRSLTFRQAIRLAGAALMPGALAMLAAILFYALALLDPIQLLAALALHFVLGWVFVFVSPFFLPRHPEAPASPRQNPFDRTKPAAPTPDGTGAQPKTGI